MKTKNIKLLTVLILLLMAGCTEDTLDEGRRVPINLKITICDSMDTRAGTSLLNSFSNGEVLGIALANCVNSDVMGLYYTTYTVGTGFASQPYIQASLTATIKGYYPSSARTASSFTVNANQTTDDNYKGSDLMYATATATKASPSPTLTFTHKMAKIILNVTPTSGVSSITSVTLNNLYRTIGFSNSTGALGALTNSGDITMSNNGAVLFPPQTTSESNNFLTIVTNAGTATYKLAKEFVGGCVYTLNISVGLTNIGTTTTITGWTGSGSVTVNPTVTNYVYGALPGVYSVSANKQVFFSQGNLQATYNGSSWTWSFATNQWDYIGNAAGNTSVTKSSPFISGTGTVDLFGWVGASSIWTGVAQYGITSSTGYSLTDGYGNIANEALKSDWGTLSISNGGSTANSNWHTLTKDEWTYVFNTRSTTSGVRYAKATVNNVIGIILLPDDWSTSYYSLTSTNNDGADFTSNSISFYEWNEKFVPHGCVFLPVAGYRLGAKVWNAGEYGHYWSSTPYPSDSRPAYSIHFGSSFINTELGDRTYGMSVRLVRPVSDPIPLAYVTPSDVGKLICSKGHIHNNVSDIDCGASASGIIAYVGDGDTSDDTYNHGLALALTDASSGVQWGVTGNICTTSYTSNKTTAIGYKNGIGCTNTFLNSCSSSHNHYAVQTLNDYESNVSRPSVSSSWFIPSLGQWNIMLKALQGTDIHYSVYDLDNGNCQNNHVNYVISNAGGTPFDGYYWSSTECGTSGYQWYIYTSEHGSDCLILASYYWKNNSYKVRPCFAF